MKIAMKNLKTLICVGFLFLVSTSTAFAQTSGPAAASSYDAELAKRLGADERGMRQYVMAFLKTGPLKVTDQAKRAELMKGHFEMINRLADEGRLIVAGPFMDGGEFRGIYLFDVKTTEEAQKLTETDPSIKEGYFKVDFIKWYGSAALMELNAIHKKIEKKAP